MQTLMSRIGAEVPIIQAPMASAQDSAMVIAACRAGAVGSLPCAMLTVEQAEKEVATIREATDKPFNINFFCHKSPAVNTAADEKWLKTLTPYYREAGLDSSSLPEAAARSPFDESFCQLVEQCKPAVVSFHFGLPDVHLLERVKAAGCLIISSATTGAEAQWLAARGCDAIIAQGVEAGGHRGIFLTDDPCRDVEKQPGLVALLAEIKDCVDIPVIAAGGIASGSAIAAALTMGAEMVQIGTSFLFTHEALISPLHSEALNQASASDTALTNIFSGRPARGIVNRVMQDLNPLCPTAPAFPTAGTALLPLKKAAEAQGRSDFSSLWAGQGVATAARVAKESLSGAQEGNRKPGTEELIGKLHTSAKGYLN